MNTLKILDNEQRAAWNEYLAATADTPEHRYLEVEPWAWAKLTLKLAAIETRRAALTERAAA